MAWIEWLCFALTAFLLAYAMHAQVVGEIDDHVLILFSLLLTLIVGVGGRCLIFEGVGGELNT